MGNTSSTPVTPPPPPDTNTSSGSDRNDSTCPMKNTSSEPSVSECPMKKDGGKYKNPNQYNVYGEKIDPKNNMPARANQEMAPGQTIPLETNRVKSNIPKGGTDDDTWSYPSPQMFWNSLVRKGKVEGAEEKDMENVVAIHNNMNENTWRQLMAWEKLREVKEEGKEPKLLHFMGRPHELSPKARIKMLFGHPAPFDRHDWVIDRGGEEVRYVIDYYHKESGVDEDKLPKHLADTTSLKSIVVDVRPALDSFPAIIDRVFRMPYEQFSNRTDYDPPPFLASSNMGTAPPFTEYKKPPAETTTVTTVPPKQYSTVEINSILDKIDANCRSQKDALASCTSEETCGAAAVALQRCSAMVVCPTIAKEFDHLVKELSNRDNGSEGTVNEDTVAKSYEAMTSCLENFSLACFNATDESEKS